MLSRRLLCGALAVVADPEASDLWTRLGQRDAGSAGALVDRSACRRYADGARSRLRARVEKETLQSRF